MKKLISVVLIVIIIACVLSGCNRQMVDTKWNFDRAIISLPNGESVEGRCESWRDYENSDMIQVKIDGKTYLTHSCNIVLIDD